MLREAGEELPTTSLIFLRLIRVPSTKPSTKYIVLQLKQLDSNLLSLHKQGALSGSSSPEFDSFSLSGHEYPHTRVCVHKRTPVAEISGVPLNAKDSGKVSTLEPYSLCFL